MWAVNVIGILLIAGIVWWFWLYKPTSKAENYTSTDQGIITVLVENGVYQPALIKIPLNQNSTLRFIRKDKTPCAETVIFDGLDISAELPVDKPVDIVLKPQLAGSFDFTCQMKMYKGQVLVQERSEHS